MPIEPSISPDVRYKPKSMPDDTPDTPKVHPATISQELVKQLERAFSLLPIMDGIPLHEHQRYYFEQAANEIETSMAKLKARFRFIEDRMRETRDRLELRAKISKRNE